MKKISLILAASAIATQANAFVAFTLTDIEYSNFYSPTATSIVSNGDTLDLSFFLSKVDTLSPGQASGEVPSQGLWAETYGSGKINLSSSNFGFDWSGDIAFNMVSNTGGTDTAYNYNSTCSPTGFFLGGLCPLPLASDGSFGVISSGSIDTNTFFSSETYTLTFNSGLQDGGVLKFIFDAEANGNYGFCLDEDGYLEILEACNQWGISPSNNPWVLSEVPIPAAAWLFGSALVSLAGVRRKQITS